jgi:two-component system chemotaxis sensor kinase CheA
MSESLTDAFLVEANELIVDLERALLILERDQHNKESISAIFRSMHTLKGAAGMFGFDSVTSITHHLESVFQDIRDDQRVMDESILRLTFKTLDQLRILLSLPPHSKPGNDYESLLNELKILAAQSAMPIASMTENTAAAASYYIYFLPNGDIFHNGTNPLYLVDDLTILGESVVLPFFSDLPSLQDIKPDTSYMGFEVLLHTSKNADDIQSVFLFVEGTCELIVKKIGEDNLLKDITNEEHPWKQRDLSSPVGFETIEKALHKKLVSNNVIEANKAIKAKSGNIRVSAEKLDDLMNLVSELVTTQARLSLYSNLNTSPELSTIAENIEKITRRLRDNAFTMSLVPLESIVVRFQRLVSDLSKELRKEIEFKAEGMETRIDKSIIEKLIDPILHLLRNCIDHGIEAPEERVTLGKEAKGVIQLKSYYSGAHVVIEIGDDGAGLNLNKIREKGIKQGLIDTAQQLSEKELTDLIFLPGFSTASTITGVSGRGVGMDVVKRNIMDLRGEIEVVTTAGKGSTFIIKLPLTLSILDGLLVKIGHTDFVLPLATVAKCYEVETEKLESTFNQWVTLDGKRTPFLLLRKNFGIDHSKPVFSQVINISFNGSSVGLAVDKIVGEYQAVLKPLGRSYAEQDEFSGATILGDGSVALVLDPNKLIKKLTIEIKPE